MTKFRSYLLLFIVISMALSGCTRGKLSSPEATPTLNITANQNPKPSEVIISKETTEYIDENNRFSFYYPQSLIFEKQTPYPGGIIKSIGFRVDGLTDSQLLSKDLSQSLKSNDLYCNLDESYGEAVCVNRSVVTFTNSKGTAGFKINREKTFYDEESGEPTIFQDIVYGFPINENNQSASYKAIVFSIKYPSSENLKILEQIADTVKTY